MTPLSNNVPDPTFPPIPPGMPAPQQTGTGGGTFADLSKDPMVEEPITMTDTDHMTATTTEGGDPLVEIPDVPGAQLADVTPSEGTGGVTLS